MHSHKLEFGLLVVCCLSSFMAGLPRAVASSERKNGSSIAVLGGNLVLQPPEGGNVEIQNFAELSAVKALLNATQADLSTTKTQLTSAMSRVDSLESLSDILPSSFTLSGTPLTGLKSSYAYIGGSLTITNNQNLKSVSLRFLTAISGSLTITGNPLLSEVSLPLLSTLGGNGSAYYILIEHNAPTITVSLLSLNLTSMSYSIYALNMSCTALAPTNCSSTLPQISIFMLGGDLGNGTLLYSLANPQWSTTAIPAMSTPRYRSPAAAFCPKSNTVYTAGGTSVNAHSNFLSSAAKLSLDTKQWSDIVSMKTPRRYTAGVCLDDGESFMVCGGYNPTVLSSCELFNPNNGTWTYTKDMTTREGHAMVLYNGKPLVLGGYSPNSYLNSASQYTPETNSWSTFPSLNAARCYFGAAVVLGKIFIAGGWDGGALSSVEFYSNGTTWIPLSSSLGAGARYYCSAVSFQNKLVVLGGTQTQVDVFDPSIGNWSTLPALSGADNYDYIAAVAF